MPELPEVERARKLVETTCKGYRIADVQTWDDAIVYTGGIIHRDFAEEIRGRTITGCSRKGKIFWIELSGDGRLPVMHFGMNGMLMLKGREPDWYMRKPRRRGEDTRVWPPPKYVKFLLKLEPQPGSVSDQPQELAYLDSRRLGKLRLLPQPVTSYPPISDLGFDPYLSPPLLPEFTTLLRTRPRSTIKGLIMDQSFSAGVGNWVADEILHLARIHPATPVASLTDQQVGEVWVCMKRVVQVAVEADADHSKFPKDWLFSWRWSKGKKDKNRKTKDATAGMRLPDGSPATLKFITVGGRTSAYIEELQKLPKGVVYKEPVKRGNKATKPGDVELLDHSSSDELTHEQGKSAVVDDDSRSTTSVKAEKDVSRSTARTIPRRLASTKRNGGNNRQPTATGDESEVLVKAEESSELSEVEHDEISGGGDTSSKIPVTRGTKPGAGTVVNSLGGKKRKHSRTPAGKVAGRDEVVDAAAKGQKRRKGKVVDRSRVAGSGSSDLSSLSGEEAV